MFIWLSALWGLAVPKSGFDTLMCCWYTSNSSAPALVCRTNYVSRPQGAWKLLRTLLSCFLAGLFQLITFQTVYNIYYITYVATLSFPKKKYIKILSRVLVNTSWHGLSARRPDTLPAIRQVWRHATYSETSNALNYKEPVVDTYRCHRIVDRIKTSKLVSCSISTL